MKCRLPSPLICISITTQRRKMRFTTLHCWKGGRIYFTLVITVSLQPYTFGQVVTVINGYHRAGPRRARGLGALSTGGKSVHQWRFGLVTQRRRSVWNIGGPNSSPLPFVPFLLFPSLPFPLAFPSTNSLPTSLSLSLSSLCYLPLFPPLREGVRGPPRKILKLFIAVGNFKRVFGQ
jgi:hypothetical protein